MKKRIPFNLQFFAEAGEEAQEFTEPAGQEEVTDNNTVEETEPVVGDETETEPTEGKTEEDSRFASVRRKAEEDARTKYETQMQNINSEFKRVFGNLKNPVTGEPIEGYQDYLNAVEAQQRLAREQEIISKGIDPRIIEDMIQSSPAIRQANQIMQDNLKNEAAQKLAADIKAVSEIDPSIKSEADIAKLETYPQILDLVSNHGLSLPEAFKLANYDSIATRKAEAAKQAAVNQAKGKNHMEQSGNGTSTSENEVDIPQSEIHIWREYYPGLSDAELKKKYNRTISN